MDIQLKQRILGAIIVLALVVIFVPMLFTKHQKEQAMLARAIPAIPEQPVINKSPLSIAQQEAQVEAILAAEEKDNKPNQAASPFDVQLQQEPTLSAPSNPDQPQPPSKNIVPENLSEPSTPQATGLQASQSPLQQPPKAKDVASTEGSSLASALSEKETAQLTHTIKKTLLNKPKKQPATNPKKYVEPYYVRENLANSNNAPIENNLKKEKKVLLKAKQHYMAWVIQLGNFDQAAYANQLVHSLREKGFTTFSYRNKNKLGHVSTKVFVGPFVKKEQARQQLQKLQLNYQQKGFVVQFNPTDLH